VDEKGGWRGEWRGKERKGGGPPKANSWIRRWSVDMLAGDDGIVPVTMSARLVIVV